jgi:hypothetical protein
MLFKLTKSVLSSYAVRESEYTGIMVRKQNIYQELLKASEIRQKSYAEERAGH